MNKEKYNEIHSCLKNIIAGTKWNGHLFAVGGCCRDYLSNREIKDIDLVVDLPNGGIEFAEWLEKNGFTKGSVVTYPHFGTAMFHLKEFPDIELEAVQTRKEAYRDMETRNPETAFGTINDDCTRRDFTYNAIYHQINEFGGFCDYNGNSLKDLKNNVLRTCGEPDVIFTEDPLRILRAIRFATRFNSTIDEKTFEGMKRNVDRLEIISKERIQDEFSKMITSDNPEFAIRLLFEIGAYKYVFDKLWFESESEYLAKSIPASFEKLKIQKDAEHNNLEINLAIVYAQLPDVVNRMKYLKFSNDVIKKVCFYLEIFDMINFTNFTPASIRKVQYVAKSYDNLFNACTIFVSVMSRKGDIERVEKIINMTKKMIEKGQAMFGYTLPVNGNDVMEILNINPSKNVKRYLNLLMDMAYVNPFITKKECETILKCN